MSLPLNETEAPITHDFSNCTVNAMVGEAVGKRYVAEHFPPEATVRMEDLVGHIRRPIEWNHRQEIAKRQRPLFQLEAEVNQLASDPHSPLKYRVNGVYRNLDAFHEAFGTKPGDGMWLAPEERVRIW